MPPRLNKRQLREKQELEELEQSRAASSLALAAERDVESDEASDSPDIRAPQGGFNALDLAEDSDDDDEIDSTTPAKSNKKNKKKKKKQSAKTVALEAESEPSQVPVIDSEPVTTESEQHHKTTKAKKKSKAKKAPAGPKKAQPKVEPDDGMDEIDRALAELAMKNGGRDTSFAETEQRERVDPTWAAVRDVFAFETKFLDSDAELRRMFGSKVIGSAPPQGGAAGAGGSRGLHARFANNPHHSTSIRRSSSHLATPEPGWPSAAGTLALTRYDGPEASRAPGDWHTYVHPPAYKQAQLMFLEVLQQADGNRLFDVLAAQPYHIDTLMQLSEMMTQQGDLGAAATHLSRALYALSTPLPATFTSGNFRLPYSQIENRAFFVGIARQVALHFKRGTWRTAFEFAKIALGTGGDADPVGMLCWIDFLAPKAGQNEWFLKLVPTLANAYPEMHVESYPGLAFARALVLRNLEDEKKEGHEKSTEALESAIVRFPVVATLLSNSLAFDLPPAMVSHARAQPAGAFTDDASYVVSLLSELYVARSAPLWKDPASLAWLRRAIVAATLKLDDSTLEDVRVGQRVWSEGVWDRGVAPAGIIRAAFISDIASIRPYLPPSARSGTTYSFDPLPPAHAGTTFYDDRYFASLYDANSRSRDRRQQRHGPPPPLAGGGGGRQANNGDGGGAVAAMRDGLARMLGIGAGAGAVDLSPELRAELMRELELLGGGGMPGGFNAGGGGDDLEDESDEDESDDDDGQDFGQEGDDEQETRNNLIGRLGALFGRGGRGDGVDAPPP